MNKNNQRCLISIVTNSTTMEMVFISSWIPYKVTISNYETINKQSDYKENVKLQMIVNENETLTRMVAKLKDDVRECKQSLLETNKCLNNITLKEEVKEEKIDTMR